MVSDTEIEAAARAIADAWGETWECCCNERRGLDCDCGDAMNDEREAYDERLSREDCRMAARAALSAAARVRAEANAGEVEVKPLANLIHDALAFAVWAAGEGLCPTDGPPAPEDFLYAYSAATGFENWDAIPHHVATTLSALTAGKPEQECATEGCDKPATDYFERGGVGSHYCHGCYVKVQAVTTPPTAGGGNE